MMLTKMERAHEKESPGEPFEKLPLPTLAKLLEEAGGIRHRGGRTAGGLAGAAGVGGAI